MTEEEQEKEYRFGYQHGMIFGAIMAMAIVFAQLLSGERLWPGLGYSVLLGLIAGLISRMILLPWKKRHFQQMKLIEK